MFKEKGFATFKVGDYETMVHYLQKDGELVFLTLNNSSKVKQFEDNPQEIQAGEGSRPKEFKNVSVQKITDADEIKSLFDEMSDLKFIHFKDFDDNLIKYRVIYQ